MSEQFPQAQGHEQLIDQVPFASQQGAAEVVPVAAAPTEQLHGGYTGINVGQMANQISRLQAAGRAEEANALIAKLNELSPGIPVEPKADK